MRSAALALVTFALLTSPAAAQPGGWADKLFGGNTKHDFGVVPTGTQLKYSFKITNIYKVPLELYKPTVSCGCLTPTLSTNLLQPGESGTLDINMDGTRFKGYKAITIRMQVGPEYVSTAVLTVTANARLDVVFTPTEIDFGLVQRGQTPNKSINIEYYGGQAWQVSEIVKTSASPYELKVEELKTRANKGYRISVTLNADAPAGPFRHEVILKTNEPTSPVLTFNVVGNVLASLKASPSKVTLASKDGKVESRKVVISGGAPFRILGIDGQGEGLTAEFGNEEGSTQIVEIRYQPTKAGDQKRQLTIRTSLEKETVTIAIDASGAP